MDSKYELLIKLLEDEKDGPLLLRLEPNATAALLKSEYHLDYDDGEVALCQSAARNHLKIVNAAGKRG